MPRQHLYDNPKSPEVSLGAFRMLLTYVRAQQSESRTKITSFSSERGESLKTLKTLLDEIENDTGTFVISRTLMNPLTSQEQGELVDYPEELEVLAAALGAAHKTTATVKRKSKVTLDGEIWAEFAEIVLQLYELTRQATYRSPVRQKPAESVDGPLKQSRLMRAVPLNVPPTRSSEADRRAYLGWLQHHNGIMNQAKDFSGQDGGSVYELLRLIPGYELEEHPAFSYGDALPPEFYDDVDEEGYPVGIR